MLHQQCDLRLLGRFNLCNHNQFDQLPNRKRQRQVRRHNNQRDQHRRQLRVRDLAHQVRDQFRHRRVHRDQFRRRQLRVDQKLV
jgi:hypothetical protein